MLMRLSLGTWKKTPVAIKKLRVSLSVSEQQEVFEDLIKECTLLSTLDHPNILTFIGLSVKAPNFAIVTEFMSRYKYSIGPSATMNGSNVLNEGAHCGTFCIPLALKKKRSS